MQTKGKMTYTMNYNYEDGDRAHEDIYACESLLILLSRFKVGVSSVSLHVYHNGEINLSVEYRLLMQQQRSHI